MTPVMELQIFVTLGFALEDQAIRLWPEWERSGENVRGAHMMDVSSCLAAYRDGLEHIPSSNGAFGV